MVLQSLRLARMGRPVVHRFQRRRAGGYPADMAVKKNKFMEEWNGQREITEKTFKVHAGNFGSLSLFLLVVPYGIYTWSRSEFLNGTDRRYHDIL